MKKKSGKRRENILIMISKNTFFWLFILNVPLFELFKTMKFSDVDGKTQCL